MRPEKHRTKTGDIADMLGCTMIVSKTNQLSHVIIPLECRCAGTQPINGIHSTNGAAYMAQTTTKGIQEMYGATVTYSKIGATASCGNSHNLTKFNILVFRPRRLTASFFIHNVE
jgi:hypothetical protein